MMATSVFQQLQQQLLLQAQVQSAAVGLVSEL